MLKEDKMRNQSGFSVPRERGDQLRTLARHQHRSVSDLIAVWIDRAMGEAGLSTSIPGVDISIVPDGLSFRVPGFDMSPTRQEGLDIADALDSVATRGRPTMTFIGKGVVDIGRQGSGIIVTVTDERGKRSQTFAPNVARTIAKQLRSAATEPATAPITTVEAMLGDLEAGT